MQNYYYFILAILIYKLGSKFNGGHSDNYPNEDITDVIEEMISKDMNLVIIAVSKDIKQMNE